jgi:SAM-dependent methyltransferase
MAHARLDVIATFGESDSMSNPDSNNLWSYAEHALEYLSRADSLPHRTEGEATLLEFIPSDLVRILDVGSGGGRLLGLVKADRPQAEFVALDFSPVMLGALHRQFDGDGKVTIVAHHFSNPLPPLGHFDCVISSFCHPSRVARAQTKPLRGSVRSYAPLGHLL